MKRSIETKFFTFNQNNSGGYFLIDEKLGIGEYIIIEALNSKDAIRRFEEIGEQYSGFYEYCECCGERWSTWMDDSDGTKTPEIYGEPPEKHTSWGRCLCFIHYLDGKIKKIELKKDESI